MKGKFDFKTRKLDILINLRDMIYSRENRTEPRYKVQLKSRMGHQLLNQ